MGINTDTGKTAPVEMKQQIEGGAHISEEGIKIHSPRGLKPPSQNLNRVKFPCTNTTPGSKGGVQRSREGVKGIQEDERDS